MKKNLYTTFDFISNEYDTTQNIQSLQENGKINFTLIPTIQLYEDICHVELPSFIPEAQFKNICKIISQSEICKTVDESDRLSCNTLNPQSQIDLWSFLKGCTQGVFNSAKSFLTFAWEIMKWVWENGTSEAQRNTTFEQATEYMNITKLYLHTEFEKSYAQVTPPFQDVKAMQAMGGAISHLVLNMISNMIVEKYQEFGCLNLETQSKAMCEFVGNIFIPPTAAIALIKWGPKAFKIFPGLEKAFQTLGTTFSRVANHEKRFQRALKFKRLLRDNGDTIWSPEISLDVKNAIYKYQKRELLFSNHIYGDSVRDLHIRGKTAQEIETILSNKGFTKHSDLIHDPYTHLPVIDSSGKTIVMDIYTHSDGGMVRVKPMGDPESRFRPAPHAIKSIRYPENAPYDQFEYEVFKIDDNGHPLPKWSKDFNNPYGNDTPEGKALLDDLADDTHVNLPHEKKGPLTRAP